MRCTPISHPLLFVGALLAMFAVGMSSTTAYADRDRWIGSVELFGTKNVDDPNRNRFGVGVGGGLRLEFLMTDYLGVQAAANASWFSKKGAVIDSNRDGAADRKDSTTFFGGSAGIRLHWSYLLMDNADDGWVDLNFLYGSNAGTKRPGLDAGIGYEFALNERGSIRLGPFFRVHWLDKPGAIVDAGGSTRNAEAPIWISFGASLSFGGGRNDKQPVAESKEDIVDLDQDYDGIPDSKDQCPNVPAGDQPDPDRTGCPMEVAEEDDEGEEYAVQTEVEEGQIALKKKLYFATNKDKILKKSGPALDEMTRAIQMTDPNVTIRIEGHTDNRGSDAYNLDLSQRRAESVLRALVERGIPAERLSAEGVGEAFPVGDNNLPEGRAANRRVEFHLVEP